MMSNGFNLNVIASLKANVASKKASGNAIIALKKVEEEKVIQNLKEKRALAYEKHMTYFFEELVNFVENEFPKRLENGNSSILNGKTYIIGDRIPFHKLDDDIGIDVGDFLSNVDEMIRDDPRFTTKCDQLLSEIGINLYFTNRKYWDQDRDIYQYPSDIREQFKNGTFYFSATI
jgi:hypothetical protein